jgi:hypothetical protein
VDRATANVALLVGILTVSALGGYAVTRVAASDINVVFVTPSVRPMPGIPTDACGAGITPDPEAAMGRASGVQFGIVRDPSDHGSLSHVADGRIATLEVTWSDAALFRTDDDTAAFLRRLVTIPKGSTTTFVPWAQALGVPSVAAIVEHAEGHRGSWHVWYAWPSVYCVYRDGNAKWWFGYWLDVDGLRLEGGKLNPA